MGEGFGVTQCPLSPIRVTLGSHDVPSALSGGHTMSPGLGTAADQTHSGVGVWTGVKHPRAEEFQRNPHPCRAQLPVPRPFSPTLFPQGSPHPEIQPLTSILRFPNSFPTLFSHWDLPIPKRNPSNPPPTPQTHPALTTPFSHPFPLCCYSKNVSTFLHLSAVANKTLENRR